MKKSNVIVFIIAVLVSAFLLGLWYFLGFNNVDNPLDLVLSILWWILIIVAICVIIKVENTRRERLRTCYITDNSIFNAELGVVALEAGQDPVDLMQFMLSNLEYGFNIQDMPENFDQKVKFVVRSKKFKVKEDAQQQDGKNYQVKASDVEEWEGNVSLKARPNDNPMEFSDRNKLEVIVAGNYAAAMGSTGNFGSMKPATA